MKSARHRARELAVQGLYDWFLTQESPIFIEQTLRENEQLAHADINFFQQLLRGCIAQAPALQEAVVPHLSRDFSMINPIERSVLLLAAYEIVNCPETPARVVINEAIEVTKTFGGPDGHKFINGVLDKLASVHRPLERNSRPSAASN